VVLVVGEAVDFTRHLEETPVIPVGEHDPLRPSGRPAGVELEHIVGELRLVGGWLRGRIAQPGVEALEGRVRPVKGYEAWRAIKLRNRGECGLEKIIPNEQQLRRCIAQDEGDLARCKPAVDWRKAGARPRGSEEERIPGV